MVGLSVGHAIAHTLALEGLVGSLRLADFDELELTNLNRVPASIFDIGVNKAVVTARRIAEIDPYLRVDVFPEGVTADNLDTFLDGVDIVVEECDSFAIKVLVRDRARALGIPVLMETSDRGTVDVERFDLEPDRPLFHGIVGELRAEDLTALSPQELTAHAAAILQPLEVSARLAASALEIGRTFSAWPQLGGDVALGGASIAAAIRRLVRGEELASGRVRIDLDAIFSDMHQPEATQPAATRATPADTTTAGTATAPSDVDAAAHGPDVEIADAQLAAAQIADVQDLDTVDLVAYAATRAPSAGNQQPWRLSRTDDGVAIRIDPSRSSSLDLNYRASAVALGAATFNMWAAATERGVPSTITIDDGHPDGTANPENTAGPDITARIHLGVGPEVTEPLPGRLDAVLRRATRRPLGDATPLSDNEIDALGQAGTTDHTRLAITDERAGMDRYGRIAADADRIRFLTPTLHKEMFDELAVAPSEAPLGIDTDSLELPPAMLAMFGLLRRTDVMELLAEWDLGEQLGADAAHRIATSSAIVGVIQRGRGVADYLRAGMVMQRVWLAAEALGFAVHPVTPMFLYAHDDETVRGLSPRFGDQLVALRADLVDLWSLADDEAVAIALRLTRTDRAPAGPASRRLPVAAVSD